VAGPTTAEMEMTDNSILADSRRNAPVQLSVIISTLSRLETARLLADRIRVLLPTLELEIIVVFPGAGEPTSSDGVVRYVADAGRGVYAAYNAGLRSCSGEYVWFIGDDDYPLDAAADICDILREGAVDLLVAPVLFSTGRIYRPSRTLLLLHFLNWCQQGIIYRRRELVRHRFFRRLPVQADQYVNILLRSDAAVTKKFLDRPICVFGADGLSGRARDSGYRSLRLALAHRTLSCGMFLAFRVLVLLEPLIKRLVKIR
jgi:glycosyltransferase involved in cell wall biosynthesis